MTQQKVNLQQFNPQQLYQLRQGFESEVNTLNQSYSQFRYAMDKYEQGRRAIKAAEDCKPNEQLLIPLSNALYIEGMMDNLNNNNERVYLIQYGAGFFVQRNAKEATEFYQRKIIMIKEKMQKVQEVIGEKKEGIRQIQMRMMNLLQQQKQTEK